MRSRFYYDGYQRGATRIRENLNSIPDLLALETANGARAVGDANR